MKFFILLNFFILTKSKIRMNQINKYISSSYSTAYKPKSINQQKYLQAIENENTKLVIANGPAGTGKTLFACISAIELLKNKNIDKIILTRPLVTVEEEIGFLPGNINQKMDPWTKPILDIFSEYYKRQEIDQMIYNNIIEIIPLGFMRGRTFKNAWIVADEMQNSTVSQMKMLLTRLGENSRLVITGDLEQYDKISELNGLEDFLQKFKGKRSASITSFEFQRCDIQREEVVKEVLDIYSAEHTLNYLPSQEEINEDLQYSENNLDEIVSTTEDKLKKKENSDKEV
jgi:phosphate starvation-inducible PhoH-like protein